MEITMSLIKELRQRTNVGMLDCKKALEATLGDLEKAINLISTTVTTKVAKKAGRIANEGLVNIAISKNSKTAIILEVNSETDFVAKGKIFIDFVNELATLALKTKPKNIAEFVITTLPDGISVDKKRGVIISKTGENITIKRVQTIDISSGIIGYYNHNNRIAVLVNIDNNNTELAKDIAMHIAASKPSVVSKDKLTEYTLAKEKEKFTIEAQKSSKPANIIEKIIKGRMQKFINSTTLYTQPFIKNLDTTVGELARSNNTEVISFIRYEVGESIQKI